MSLRSFTAAIDTKDVQISYTRDALGNILQQTETDTTGNTSTGQIRTWSYVYNTHPRIKHASASKGQVLYCDISAFNAKPLTTISIALCAISMPASSLFLL
jgi:hypothetical protein